MLDLNIELTIDVAVFKRLRQAINRGHVAFNYWQNIEEGTSRIPKKIRTDTNASLISILEKNAEKQWDGQWQLMYDQLVEYLRVNGHTNVSSLTPKQKFVCGRKLSDTNTHCYQMKEK